MRDVRLSLRTLARSPGFTGAVVLAVSLGIGSTTAIFSVVNAVLLRPLPYPDADGLVMVEASYQVLGMENLGASAPEFLDYRAGTRSFDAVAAFQGTSLNLTGDGEPERVPAARVSAGLFPLLRTAPVLGRVLREDESEAGDAVAVLSHGLWRRRFASDPAVLGRSVTLDGRGFTIVGVMPLGFEFPHPSFRFGERADVWLPLTFSEEQLRERGRYDLRVIARLRAGVSLEQAREEMAALAKRFDQANPGLYRGPGGVDGGFRLTAVPFKDEVVGGAGRGLLVLQGASLLLLLVACVNVSNLFVARALEREKSLAIRQAMGATRLRLVRELFVESVVGGGLGCALGLLFARWGTDLLGALGADVPRLAEVDVDGRVLGVALGLSLVACVGFGLWPALQASRPSLAGALKEGGRSGAAKAPMRLRHALVVAEHALALVLLIGAGLLVKSFARLQAVRPGFEASGVLTMELALPGARYAEERRRVELFRRVLERTRALPGVRDAGLVSLLPLAGSAFTAPFSVEGRPFDPQGAPPVATYRSMSPGYLRAMGVPLARGREFDDRDVAGATRVVVVNETLARTFLQDGDVLGRRVKLGAPGSPRPWLTIVGVAGDVSDRGLESPPRPEMYVPDLQEAGLSMTLVARAAGDTESLAPAVRAAVLAADPEQPVSNVRTMARIVSDSVAERRFSTTLLSAFAALALALAAVGLYGVTAYAVGRRTREIGVRIALGAGRRDILRLVLGQGLGITLVALPLGLAGALALGRVLSSLLYGITATDPETYLTVVLLLSAVALLASYVPARRAAGVDPLVALRYE